jgi:hypothetical protein
MLANLGLAEIVIRSVGVQSSETANAGHCVAKELSAAGDFLQFSAVHRAGLSLKLTLEAVSLRHVARRMTPLCF